MLLEDQYSGQKFEVHVSTCCRLFHIHLSLNPSESAIFAQKYLHSSVFAV